MAYYAIVAFWTSAVSKGVFPQWVPFQQMGYPFALQVASGIYYPPLWVFPLFGIQYTLHAAVVVQCLHVLLGSLGMYLYLKHLLGSTRIAFVGALVFQFFGGFYSNAEHVNIVRSFAFSPWILHVFTLDMTTNLRLPRRALLIPAVVFVLSAGGYPGNLLSTAFVMMLYLLLQLGVAYRTGKSLQQLRTPAARVTGLTLLGLAMAALPLGPMWAFRGQLARYAQGVSLERVGLWVEDLPSLFLSNKLLAGEPSMNSMYVTLPFAVFASFVPLSTAKRYWIHAVVGVTGLLMVAGDKSFVFSLVTRVASPLRFSRFPSSDYRVFIAIPIILFSLLGLRAVMCGQLTSRGVASRIGIIVLWFSQGVYSAYKGVWNVRVLAPVAVAAATLLLLLYLWRRAQSGRIALSAGLSLVIIGLVSLDALRVLPDMATWQMPAISSWYDSFGWPYQRDDRLVAYSIFEDAPKRRPPRQEAHRHMFSWGGYVDGRYMLLDKPPILLRRAEVAESDPVYKRYMLMQWSPVLLDPVLGAREVSLPDSDLGYSENQELNTAGGVVQTRYGVDDITYQVSLSEPKLLVENEMYFPGWEARLVFRDRETKLQALAVNDVFRAWALPAGHYKMIARFQLPYSSVYWAVCLSALVVWLWILAMYSLGRLRGSVT